MSDLSLTFTYHPLEYSLQKNPKAVKYFKIKRDNTSYRVYAL